MGNLIPKPPVSIRDIGAVLGFVLMVGVSVALLNRIGPAKRLLNG